MGTWDVSEAPVAAIGLSLRTPQGVLRWVYRACRNQILPYWNNRGNLLCCQHWTLQSRTAVFHSVSSHPTPSWLPSMYSDRCNQTKSTTPLTSLSGSCVSQPQRSMERPLISPSQHGSMASPLSSCVLILISLSLKWE